MMEVFSVRAKAAVQVSVDEFGQDAEKAVWYKWAEANPQIRRNASDPADDGNGPMPQELRETILACLRKRYDYLRKLGKSPLTTADDMVELVNKMSYLFSIARRLSVGPLGWPLSV